MLVYYRCIVEKCDKLWIFNPFYANIIGRNLYGVHKQKCVGDALELGTFDFLFSGGLRHFVVRGRRFLYCGGVCEPV